MREALFETDDAVRFVGTDTVFTVTKCHKSNNEYEIQRDDRGADLQRVGEIYLELVEPGRFESSQYAAD
jgi:hypothetical protein